MDRKSFRIIFNPCRRTRAFAPCCSPRTGVCGWAPSDGLIELKDGRERLFTTKNGLADNWILDLEREPGRLPVDRARAADSAGCAARIDEIDSFRPQDGLSQSTVFSLYTDREGSLWVGTKHGLNQFLDGRAVPYTMNEGLPSNDTGPVLQDRAGSIWVGTLGAGLSRFDGRKFTVLTTKQGLASNFINALADDADGGLWVGTDHGLNHLRDGRVDRTYSDGNGLAFE